MSYELQRYLDMGMSSGNLQFFQKIPLKFAREIVRIVGKCPNENSWDHRLIPANFFSNSEEKDILEMRQFGSLFIYQFQKELDAFAESSSLVLEEVKRDKIYQEKIFQQDLKKWDLLDFLSPESHCWMKNKYLPQINVILELALSTWEFFHQDFYFSETPKYLSFNQCLGLIRAYEKNYFFLEKCRCGKPILLPNEIIYTQELTFKRNFFKCPWCLIQNKELNLYFEHLLNRHKEWVGLEEDKKEKEK